MWHYAQYHGKELLVIGHAPRRNDCILVELEKLPMNEAVELRRIAQSRVGQEHDRLVPVLEKLQAPDRINNWFSYLCYKMEQRNGPVFTLPLKEVQDSLDEDQRAIFKGYGQGRKNKYLETLDYSGADNNLPGVEITEPAAPSVNTPMTNGRLESFTPVQPAPASGDLGYKMDMMLETLVDENRRTQGLLQKLIGALTDGVESEIPLEPVKPKRPRRAKPKAETAERLI